jgi:hypothetical protein
VERLIPAWGCVEKIERCVGRTGSGRGREAGGRERTKKAELFPDQNEATPASMRRRARYIGGLPPRSLLGERLPLIDQAMHRREIRVSLTKAVGQVAVAGFSDG